MRVKSHPTSVAADTDGFVAAYESADPRLPSWLALSLGFGATMVAAVVLKETGTWAKGGAGLAVMGAAVAVVSWWSRPLLSLTAAAFGWLMLNGFVVNQFGDLRWHGVSDATRLVALVVAALVSGIVRVFQVRLTRRVLIEEFPPTCR